MHIKILKINKTILLSILIMFFILIGFIILFTYQIAKAVNLADPENETINLPIIMYHSVEAKSKNRFTIKPQEFEDDLKFLKEKNYNTIFVQDLIDYTENKKDLPENPIILSFDDGYYNNYENVFPLIKKYNYKIVISPICSVTQTYSENPSKNLIYACLSWENLREMQDSGLVEIQNHSYDMHKRNKKRVGAKKNKNESLHEYKNALEQDLTTAQDIFDKNLDKVPTTFVFPFGAISNCSLDITKNLGFKAIFSCSEKINKISKSPDSLFFLGRFLRPPGKSSEKFFRKILEK